MQLQTQIPHGFSDVVDGCDYKTWYNILLIFVATEDQADDLVSDRQRLRKWLSNKCPDLDGCFIDFRDGTRQHAFTLNQPIPRTRYPFQVADSWSLFSALALGRVSPCITWVYEISPDGDELELIYSNQDGDGSTTAQWNSEPNYRPEAVAGRVPTIGDWTWRGRNYRIVQYNVT